jgi:hypothetical protein
VVENFAYSSLTQTWILWLLVKVLAQKCIFLHCRPIQNLIRISAALQIVALSFDGAQDFELDSPNGYVPFKLRTRNSHKKRELNLNRFQQYYHNQIFHRVLTRAHVDIGQWGLCYTLEVTYAVVKQEPPATLWHLLQHILCSLWKLDWPPNSSVYVLNLRHAVWESNCGPRSVTIQDHRLWFTHGQ